MKVIWTPEAEADRLAIGDYIAADNPRAAIAIDLLLGTSVLKLVDFPRSGRPGLVPDTRELLPHPSYRIVYEIRDGVVWIVAVVHTARQWPPMPEGGS